MMCSLKWIADTDYSTGSRAVYVTNGEQISLIIRATQSWSQLLRDSRRTSMRLEKKQTGQYLRLCVPLNSCVHPRSPYSVNWTYKQRINKAFHISQVQQVKILVPCLNSSLGSCNTKWFRWENKNRKKRPRDLCPAGRWHRASTLRLSCQPQIRLHLFALRAPAASVPTFSI